MLEAPEHTVALVGKETQGDLVGGRGLRHPTFPLETLAGFSLGVRFRGGGCLVRHSVEAYCLLVTRPEECHGIRV